MLKPLPRPLVQLDGGVARRIGGSGLGPVLSRRIAGFPGGYIAASGVPDQGSRLSLIPPLQAAAKQPA